MTIPRRYESPAALERAISDLLRRRYPREEILLRRNEIAYRRLVARMYVSEPDRWVLKGGFAMILRLDPNRTSNDIDVAYVASSGEHAVALAALERAVATDLDDFFSFEIIRIGEETEDRALRVAMVSRLGAREFARIRVDLAMSSPEVPAETTEAPPLTGVEEIDAIPPVLTLAWPQQIADKVCAVFEEHGHGFSSRGRDLADLGMIGQQVPDLAGTALVDALRAEEHRRKDRSLPAGLPGSFVLSDAQEQEWRRTFKRASRGAPISFDDALATAKALVDPLLDGSADGKIWSPQKQSYE